MRVAEFAQQVQHHVVREDGSGLAKLFSMHAPSTRRCFATIANPSASTVHSLLPPLPPPWPDLCTQYLRSGALLFGPSGPTRTPSESWTLACDALQGVLTAFLRYTTQLSAGRWVLPLLLSLLGDLRWVSQHADDALNAATHAATPDARPSHKYTEDCARQLNKAFSACVADRNPSLDESKKWATYALVGMLFRLYFQLHSTALCKNVLRALSAADLPPMDQFPRADQTTFHYYCGRLAFMDEQYGRADAELSQAFSDAPKSAVHNCERILLYLIPTRLLLGIRPARALLSVYPRLEALYKALIEACCEGAVARYDALIADLPTERTLVRLGVYLAFERARELCVARLFSRAYAVSGKETRMRLAAFQHALAWQGVHTNVREAEWALATLVAKGRIKGYIAHERQVVVLSAKDPFPAPTLAMLT
ncbi:COP9 signalosome (CSN) subunit [Malassezia vespertilionis]|uniref:Csn12p n=1 Tax=Malassezia vespertilionis TaxID=2020962 RepID=A0A2N1J8L4_9BASI|nr:COP9 signalosome (CSN) subunit [Malassezia vespertilionis]PKI82888.1 Csn12p [Malassezia vespertilionis]WFD08274.1 COP9 signalosome (CSN) subunit [Malassezia vespertilionis]